MLVHWETLKVEGCNMNTLLIEPETSGLRPAVVVVMGRTGIDEALQEHVSDLAVHGFVGIAPDMFHREDPKSPDYQTANTRVLDANIEKDIDSAIYHLETQAAVDPKRIGIVGFCMGGRISYLMATRNPKLKTAAIYYGGNIMKARGDGPSPFEQTVKISCPLIGFFGLDDENPSPNDVEMIDRELARLGKEHEFHSYPNTGHGFMGKGKSYREHSANDAWPRTLDWFRKYLA